ncbi:MAG: class I SAM-dependent methyltransferase [Chthoniobacterales bacterium]|nr:class I SAM-dependent methyltransferase [Chthoniobacterales bacterium]
MTAAIPGQLNEEERRILASAVCDAIKRPQVVLEVGTWLGGGSTLVFLRGLQQNGAGHLWGIEADRSVYDAMLANIRAAAPEALHRFTPLFGFSDAIIPKWVSDNGGDLSVDLVFLDGGDNPMEQVTEFHLLDPHIPIGGELFSHDAKLRKGKWLVPYVSALDNWSAQLHDVSEEGLFQAKKIRERPSQQSLRAAAAVLWRRRLNPVELVGAFLPSAVNTALLRLLPSSVAKRITQGRRH